jgi:hypothetical protein
LRSTWPARGFEWAVVDQDVLLPYNLAHQIRLAFGVEVPKAHTVAAATDSARPGLSWPAARLRCRTVPPSVFKTPLLYRRVRHPIYLGFLLAFWSTPAMTVGHLLFAVATSGYILIGIYPKERDLIGIFGDQYRRYRDQVSMLIPMPGRKAERSSTTTVGEVDRWYRRRCNARQRRWPLISQATRRHQSWCRRRCRTGCVFRNEPEVKGRISTIGIDVIS